MAKLAVRICAWLEPLSARVWRRNRLVRFRADERGVVAVIFAIIFSAILLAVAIAIDFARTATEYVRVQNAVDSAALAASHQLGLPNQDTQGRADADAYFKANTAKHKNVGTLTTVVLDASKGEVNATAKGNMLTSLLRAAGITQIGFYNQSTVKKGRGTIEVALVLDNSGSMGGQPIADLRTAAQSLVNVLFTGYEGTDKVKVGVVPFAAAVNVGTQYKTAAWMDTAGVSPTHMENFVDATRTRFQLLSDMSVAWAGCVEVRPSPHDVTDSVPTAGTPASLFVPMFNPDEPDPANSAGASYGNNYLSDTGGTCPVPPRTCLHTNRRGNCTSWSQPPPLAPADAQARTCKYAGASVGSQGPNYLCDSQPILPLTTSKASVQTMISGLIAKGGTNILEGLMWGWRVVSPEEPFTEGRSYSDPENTKYIILMTDGENWHQAMSNHNKSTYHSFGYAAKGRLGTTYTTSALIAQMNTKTLAACQNAKATGIKVYTIAFRLDDPSTRAMLASCASSTAEAYAASDGTALVQAFESIAREIAKLRVAG